LLQSVPEGVHERVAEQEHGAGISAQVGVPERAAGAIDQTYDTTTSVVWTV
jgi:hypothetical protein